MKRMSKPMPRKRKEALKAKAKAMRDAKRLKRGEASVEEAATMYVASIEESTSVLTNESFVLPPSRIF